MKTLFYLDFFENKFSENLSYQTACKERFENSKNYETLWDMYYNIWDSLKYIVFMQKYIIQFFLLPEITLRK